MIRAAEDTWITEKGASDSDERDLPLPNRLGGEVVRRPVAEVEAELAAAEDAARAADEEARRKLREERKAEQKEKVQQKIDELKAKLGVS